MLMGILFLIFLGITGTAQKLLVPAQTSRFTLTFLLPEDISVELMFLVFLKSRQTRTYIETVHHPLLAIKRNLELKGIMYEWSVLHFRYQHQNALCGPSMDMKSMRTIKITQFWRIPCRKVLNLPWSLGSLKKNILAPTTAVLLIAMEVTWWKLI